MRGIKGLILKDLLNLNHYRTTLIVTVIIFGMIFISQQDLSNILPVIIIMMIGMISLSTFSYDEVSKIDKFILTLPTNRKEIVKAKYIFIIGLTIIGAIIAFVINFIFSYFVFKQVPDLANSLVSILGGLLGIGIVESIQIPSIYKWGAEKGKIQMFVIFVIIMAICGGIALLAKNMNINLEISSLNNILNIFGIPILILTIICMYFISYKISNKIYAKKEI